MTQPLAHVTLEAGLSPAEAEALFLAAEGLGYAEIAARLRISTHAVECRLSTARQKLLRQQAQRETVAWQQRPERTERERLDWRRRQFDEAIRQADA